VSGFGDWFMGRTPQQRERQRSVAEHPRRSMLLYGGSFGAAMGVVMFLLGSGFVASVIAAVVAGAIFGPAMVAVAARSARKGP
jgi:Flp pilus assembly protein TadB